MNSLTYKNVIYYIEKNAMEVSDQYWERAWFIVKNAQEGKITSSLIAVSNVWACIKFNGCVYDAAVMEQCAAMEHNVHYKWT